MGAITNNDLVDMVEGSPGWERCGLQPDPRVMDALRNVDRKKFLPDFPIGLDTVDGDFKELVVQAYRDSKGNGKAIDPVLMQKAFLQILASPTYYTNIRDLAYSNVPLNIDHNGQTCSQPFTVAVFSQLLDPKPGMRVLEIGLDCGYHAGVTANLIGNDGELVAIDRDEELVQFGEKNLMQYLTDSGLKSKASCICEDGRDGYPELGTYDRIYFTARAEKDFDIEPVLKQLSPNGRLLLPSTREGHYGPLLVYEKKGEGSEHREFGNFGFVPLTEGVREKSA